MISGLNTQTYDEKLTELSILSLRRRRQMIDLINTFKIVRNVDNVNRNQWFHTVSEQPTRATRQTSCEFNLCRKEWRTDQRRNFYSVRVIDVWNRLPTELKMSHSVNMFKYNLKKKMLSGEV